MVICRGIWFGFISMRLGMAVEIGITGPLRIPITGRAVLFIVK